MQTSAIAVDALSVAYGDKVVLRVEEWRVPVGSMMAIVGPNGAGKSTLLKAILGLLRSTGNAQFFGQPLKAMRSKIAYVPQRNSVDWDFPTTVSDVVAMGTYGQLGWFRKPGRRERDVVSQSLDRMGMSEFADRQIGELSGGQQQRTFLARALAQNADLYLLDEPLQGVDATTESAIVQLLKTLQKAGKTIVAVHHDLGTAPEYFDSCTLLNRRIVASGPTTTAFTADAVAATYGAKVRTA
jgi:manganese/zinc/iron transport system ATP- binding protein